MNAYRISPRVTLWVGLLFLTKALPAQPVELLDAGRQGPVPFLVWLKPQADLSAADRLRSKAAKGQWVWEALQRTRASQAPLVAWLEEKAIPFRAFSIVNAIAVRGDADLMRRLAARPEVKRLVPDPKVFFEPAWPDRSRVGGRQEAEWGVLKIRGNEVWARGFTGKGITIGGQDTGYDWDHPALKEQYRGYANETVDHNYHWHDAIRELSPLHNDSTDGPENNPCGFDSDRPCDDGTHGTHTMGIALGDDGQGNRIGVAPDANWIGCRNMDRGWGRPSTYLECFEWFLAPTDLEGRNPDPTRAPHVINNSWSCPEIEGCNPDNWQLMEAAIEALRAAGVVVVVSAGNNGPACQTAVRAPARFAGSFAIGATTEADRLARFSSRGPVVDADGTLRIKPNVVAPGLRIRSALADGGYTTFSGTSMSGPHVAGAIALLLSANPALAGQVATIERLLEETASPLTGEADCSSPNTEALPDPSFGYGRIDALAAVERALELAEETGAEQGGNVFQIFPNPAGALLFVSAEGLAGTIQATLFNPQGQQVRTNRWETKGVLAEKMDLAGLPKGLYVLQLSHADGQEQLRVLKK